MAAPVKDGKIWRHRLMVKGVRVSGTFETKAAALAWEATQRVQLADGKAIRRVFAGFQMGTTGIQ